MHAGRGNPAGIACRPTFPSRSHRSAGPAPAGQPRSAPMKPLPLLTLAASALLAAVPSAAQASPQHDARHVGQAVASIAGQDPFASVYVVASRDTWDNGLRTIARDGVERRDS